MFEFSVNKNMIKNIDKRRIPTYLLAYLLTIIAKKLKIIVEQGRVVLFSVVNQSSTNFGIAFKHGGHGDGPRSSCMSYVGLEPATMIAFSGDKFPSGKGSQRSFTKI